VISKYEYRYTRAEGVKKNMPLLQKCIQTDCKVIGCLKHVILPSKVVIAQAYVICSSISCYLLKHKLLCFLLKQISLEYLFLLKHKYLLKHKLLLLKHISLEYKKYELLSY